MRSNRLYVWLALLTVATVLLFLVGCGGTSNSGSNSNPGTNNGGSTPGGSNPGSGGTSGGTGGGTSSSNEILYTGSLYTTLNALKVDPASGKLSPLAGSPYTTGPEPNALATDPNHRFLYVGIGQQQAYRGANCFDFHSQLFSYAIANDGSLSPIEQLTLPTFCEAEVLVDPSGKHLYVMSQDQSASGAFIMAYSIGSDGHLTQLPGTPYHFPDAIPGRAEFSADGRFIYANDTGSDNGIVVLSRDPSTGVLTESQRLPLGGGRYISDIALVANGSYLVAVQSRNSAGKSVLVYPVNNGTVGSPREINNADVEQAASVVGDRTGQYVLMTTADTMKVKSFAIDASGNLSLASTVSNSDAAYDITVDATNHFVYTQNAGNPTISGFTFDPATGKLGTMDGSPFTLSTGALRLLVVSK